MATEDKKINEVGTSANADYVIGTLENGCLVRIPKAELAKVVGEQLSFLGLYPFMNRGTASGDLFGDLEDGYYALNSDLSPIDNKPFDYGLMMRLTSSYGYGIMLAIDVLRGKLYTSTRNNIDNWSDWV